jgi:hypothetical protein
MACEHGGTAQHRALGGLFVLIIFVEAQVDDNAGISLSRLRWLMRSVKLNVYDWRFIFKSKLNNGIANLELVAVSY